MFASGWSTMAFSSSSVLWRFLFLENMFLENMFLGNVFLGNVFLEISTLRLPSQKGQKPRRLQLKATDFL